MEVYAENPNIEDVHVRVLHGSSNNSHIVQAMSSDTVFTANSTEIPVHVTADHNISLVLKIELHDDGLGIARIVPDESLGLNYVAMTPCRTKGFGDICKIIVGNPFDGQVSVTLNLPRHRQYSEAPCNVTVFGRTYENEDVISYSLSKDEFLPIEDECDLTGTVIESEGEVSVFAGTYSSSGDLLAFEQMLPVSTWGSQFIVYTPQGDGYLNIVSKDDNTTIKVYDHGKFLYFPRESTLTLPMPSNEAVYLISSEPVSVFLTLLDSLLTVSPFGQRCRCLNESYVSHSETYFWTPNQTYLEDNVLNYAGCGHTDSCQMSEYKCCGYMMVDNRGGTMLDTDLENLVKLG